MDFIKATFPQLDVVSLEIRPLAVSLNSFNGFLHLRDGSSLFFKTHTESDNVIGEYYRAGVLADAGYPVIRPIYQSTEAGKHLLIYEVIESPSVFELAWDIENGRQVERLEPLKAAQNQSDKDLFGFYQNTLDYQTAEDAAAEPIHQLFHHRLTKGRYERFYGEGQTFQFPHGTFDTQSVWDVKWVVNGQGYFTSLKQIIHDAIAILEPEQAAPSIIGHGDAHNGNVFFHEDTLLYFDPAFAGRHHPLLDLTKPFFHNVFAMWMYYADDINQRLKIDVEVRDNTWHITYDYPLHDVREMFLGSKLEYTLIPTLKLLKEKSWLRPDWRAYLKAALFCCPFLTMNLADNEKFPPNVALLGLTMAVEMGADSLGVRSRIDAMLDRAEQALND